MSEAGKERCGCCRFWRRHGATGAVGECRRHAPRPSVPPHAGYQGSLAALWFTTDANDWCGEFVALSPEVLEPTLALSVRELTSDTRILNILSGSMTDPAVDTIGQLVRLSADELLAYRGLGTYTLHQLRVALASRFGLALRGELAETWFPQAQDSASGNGAAPEPEVGDSGPHDAPAIGQGLPYSQEAV